MSTLHKGVAAPEKGESLKNGIASLHQWYLAQQNTDTDQDRQDQLITRTMRFIARAIEEEPSDPKPVLLLGQMLLGMRRPVVANTLYKNWMHYYGDNPLIKTAYEATSGVSPN